MNRTFLALLAAGSLGLAACDAPTAAPPTATPSATTPIEEVAETLTLRAGPATGDRVTVDLYYQRRADQVAPRMMELWVDVGAGLAYIDAEPLTAAVSAGKELVVQQRAASLRVVLYAASNTAPLGSGPLARLNLRRLPDAPATLTLVPQLPIFAPASANDGLLLGPPLALSAAPAPGGTP